MNIFSLTVLIFIEFHINFAITPGYFDVSIGKCDGLFSGEIGKFTTNKTLSFLQEISTTSKETCQRICSRILSDCWFIEYTETSCRLYSSLLSYEIGSGKYFEYWKCAEPICVKFPQRCKGYLVGYDNYQFNTLTNFPIKTLYNITIFNCQQLCWSNPMCGSINFNNFNSNLKTDSIGICLLTFGYISPLKHSEILSNDSHSVTIRCCGKDLDLQDYSDENIMINNKNRLFGKWKLANSKYSLSYFNEIEYSKFYSMDIENCVKTCSKNPFCLMPIYIDDFIPFCYSIENPKIGNFPMITNLTNVLTNDSKYYIWEWNTIITKPIPEIFNNDLLSCYRFKKNGKLLIKNQNCIKFNEIELNATLNLFVENKPLKTNQSILVNDGYKEFKVILNENQMEKCERYNCEIYGNIMNNRNKLMFIDRDKWFPAIPRQRDTLKLPVEYVIVHNTYKPNGRCFSKESCSAFIRDFQSFHMNLKGYSDIAYNFLIGEDGKVYEGRGWKFVGSHTKGSNSISIGVAFIGWFENVEPNSKAFVALKNLIHYGIENNYIASQYSLTTFRELRGGENPGIKLHNIIKSWGFMNLSTIQICPQNKISNNYWYFFIGFSGIILCFIFIIVVSCQFGVHKSRNCKIVKDQLKSSDLKIGWYFDDNFEMKFEKINVRKDWIYYCEESDKRNKHLCRCYINFYALWIYCLMMPSANFMYKLMILKKSLNCSKQTHLYAFKSDITNHESKSFIFFHTNIIPIDKRESYFCKLKSSKLCVCRRFSVKKLPKCNHENLIKYLPTSLEIIASDNKNFENSTKYKSILI